MEIEFTQAPNIYENFVTVTYNICTGHKNTGKFNSISNKKQNCSQKHVSFFRFISQCLPEIETARV